MESVSVSSCSPEGSASKKKVNIPRKTSHLDTVNRHQSTNTLRYDDSLRTTKGEKQSQSLDERRDDHFTVNRPMWRQLPMRTTGRLHWYSNRNYLPRAYYLPSVAGAPPPRWYQAPHSAKWYPQGIHKPTNRPAHDSGSRPWTTHGRRVEYTHHNTSGPIRSARGSNSANGIHLQPFPGSSKKNATGPSHQTSRVVFPQNIMIPKAISPSMNHPDRDRHIKRPNNDALDRSVSPPTKKSKGGTMSEGFDKLDLLCSATLDLGPLQENPTGCSCPKSRCIALYCDCFKAGRRCDPSKCSCLNCLNTVKESGPKGARSRVSARMC